MEFKEFSKKQMKVLSWWMDESPYKDYDAIICDGAVRSGKTMCMGLSFIAWAFYKYNQKNFAVCGKTIKSIRRNFIEPILCILPKLGFQCNFKISESILEIRAKDKFNKFYLFGGKDEASASLIQGMTLAGIVFDEVALMPRSFVEQAITRCSVEGSRFWFNCNPEYPGHWFYQEWILGKNTKKAFYLHFCMMDNPSLSKRILKRYENLYTGAFYERFVLGKWVAAHGAVYPEMSKNDSFVDVPSVEFEKYYISCDYGTVNPASFGFWGKFKETFYRIREYYYDSRKMGVARTDEEHYEGLLNLTDGLKIEAITVDPSAASFIALIRKKGQFNIYPAKNQVVDGIRQVSTALKKGTIKICNTCKDSIREFSLYRWEDSMSRDVPIKENDHAMDDIRYFVTTLMGEKNTDEGFYAISATRN